MFFLRAFLLFIFFSNLAFSKSAQIVSSGTMIGKVPETFCEDKSFASFKLFVSKSNFVEIYIQKKLESTMVIFDDVGLEYKNDKKFIDLFCSKKKLNIHDDALFAIMKRMKAAMPACTVFVEKKKGLVCQIKNLKDKFKNKLNHHLIALKRQSYRLSRMILLSQQILKASHSKQKSVDSVCTLIRSSNPVELPVILKAQKNQDLFCNKNSEVRSYFASFIKAEANLLIQYIKANTHLGVIKLVGPIQKQDYTISVSPGLSFNLKSSSKIKTFAKGCMYPYLKPDPQQVEYLKSLGLFDPACHHERVTPEIKRDSLKQLWSLAASDGEFEVSMNRGKYIRLPTGDTQLQIQKAQNLGKPKVKSTKIQKELLWNNKKRVFKVKL